MSSTWDKVKLARDLKRPTSITLINYLVTNFIELHGDRIIGDDKSVIGGLGFFNKRPVTIIGLEKGIDTNSKIYHNFGMPHPEGYHKALRLMKQAEKFNRPIITIIDTPGAYPGVKAEERGQAGAIANILKEMINIKVPIIAVVLSEGGSGGALAIGVSDKIFMFENSIYSVLSPEGFASIMYKDASKAKEASEIMKITASDLYDFKIIDKVIKEEVPLSVNYLKSFSLLKKEIELSLDELTKLSSEKLVDNRFNKFMNIGIFEKEVNL